MAKLRVALTIPGAVSLGAYQGGALAALLVAARALGEEVLVIDAIASASAGSVSAVLVARSLLRGVDPVGLLAAVWVGQVSMAALKTHSSKSPLSPTALTTIARRVLGEGGLPEGP